MRTDWLQAHRATKEAEQAMADVVNVGLQGCCPFHTRCPRVIEGTCDREVPPIRRFDEDHLIACHLEPGSLSEA